LTQRFVSGLHIDLMTTQAAATSSAAVVVVRNFRAVLLAATVSLACLLGFAVEYRSPIGIGALILGIYAVFASIEFWRGVTLDDASISFPKPLLRHMPFLVWGRESVSHSVLRDLTSAGRQFGFDVVVFAFGETACAVAFASRSKKLKFFDSVRQRRPEVRIYRAV
jgi:hypothetical protein